MVKQIFGFLGMMMAMTEVLLLEESGSGFKYTMSKEGYGTGSDAYSRHDYSTVQSSISRRRNYNRRVGICTSRLKN